MLVFAFFVFLCKALRLTIAPLKEYIKVMKLEGVVGDIIFRNKETGYTILEIKQGMVSSVATGKFPIVGTGEEVVLEGEYQVNPKYGRQFAATSIKISEPTTRDTIIKYLSSGLITGVGVVTATNIVNVFGEKTLKVIEEEPMKLKQVKGVSERKAVEIFQCYQDIKKMQNAVMFLQKYDISINLAVKIYEVYKDKTKLMLQKNPYKLVEDVDGVGFKTADKIASKMGVKEDSPFRIKAGIVYCLNEYAEKQGSTVIAKNKLCESALGTLELPVSYEGEVLGEITNLEIEGTLKSTLLDDEDAVAITKLYNMEKYIASKLKLLSNTSSNLKLNYAKDIDEFERANNLALHENQRRAIESACKEGVSVITGGPGTGKTTIIKAILHILEAHGQKIMLMAPTGRAAKRMEEQTGKEAATIHRALEVNFNSGRLGFNRNENNPLETDVVIVDEVSMIDVYVLSSLLRALTPRTKLILVGDKDQLMSVGAGNVLGDIIASEQVNTLTLTQIYRQAETSMIILNAHAINNGEMPDLSKKSSDFFYSSSFVPSEVASEIVDMVAERIPKFRSDIPSEKIQVIAPMKAGDAGTNNLNVLLREKLNPKDPSKAEMEFHKVIYRVGDKVMQTANNYEQQWIKIENGRVVEGMGVFNGDIGYIDQINVQSGEVYVCFEDGRRAGYSIVEMEDLVHAYAITIHKSQGSEFDAVIIPILGGNPMLFSKNLLYTAVTRAKKMVVLIGKKTNIYHMIKNEYMVRRNTNLKKFLCSNDYMLS